MNARLALLQRSTALIMAPLVLVHLVLIIVAVRGGLSADEILSRTRGSVAWVLFYSLFVFMAATHGSIGLRAVLSEWAGWRGRSLDGASLLFGFMLTVIGLRAVWAVTL